MRGAAFVLAFALSGGFSASARAAECSGPQTLNAKPYAAPELMQVAPDAPARVPFGKGGAFVTPGGDVIVNGGAGDEACATFTAGPPAMTSTSGFLPRSALAPAPAAASAPDWEGEWRSGEERRITLSRSGAAFEVKGQASVGAGEAGRTSGASVNAGSLDAKAPPKGIELAFAMGDDGETLPIDAARKSEADFCRVRMLRLGPYLVVADNASCGGATVTFTGVYRRR